MSNTEYTLKPILLAIWVLLVEFSLYLTKLLKLIASAIKWIFLRIKRYFFHALIAFIAFYSGAYYNDIYNHYQFKVLLKPKGVERHRPPARPQYVDINQGENMAFYTEEMW